MVKFKLVISDPKTGSSKSVEVEGAQAQSLIGQKIGDVVDGAIAGIQNANLLITGGSDKDGFPMRPNVHGGARIPVLLSGGAGFRSNRKGLRRRKAVRGNIIGDNIVQINMKIVEKSEKSK